MMISLRVYCPDQDEPVQSPLGRVVLCDVVEVSGQVPHTVATVKTHVSISGQLVDLTVQILDVMAHLAILAPDGHALYDNGVIS
jgi:hypothetical protein